MGSTINEDMCTFKSHICQLQYPKNFREISLYANYDILCRHCCYNAIYFRNDRQNAHQGNSQGIFFVMKLKITIDLYDFLQGDRPYLKDHWCQFDASMVFFLWISVILQVFEMLSIVPRFSYLSILRAPRPLIMIRFLRVFLKFSMPKSRINQIFK